MLHSVLSRVYDVLPRRLSGKESTCKCRRPGSDPWMGTIPWRREWQPTPVLFPGESQGQRSLAGRGPWGHKESDETEQLNSNKVLMTSVQSSPAAQLCPTLCDPMNRSTPGLPVHHQLPELTQAHIH